MLIVIGQKNFHKKFQNPSKPSKFNFPITVQTYKQTYGQSKLQNGLAVKKKGRHATDILTRII